MRKFLMTAPLCLLLCFPVLTASANSWGLTGGIYDIVSDDDRYDDDLYSALADDGNARMNGRHVNHAILKSRYHQVLIAAARQGKVWEAETISTIAVYQPGDARGASPSLTHVNGGFCLTYGNREAYTFLEEDGVYRLADARYLMDQAYSNSYSPHEEGLLFFQAGPENSGLPIGDALWRTDGITLAEFNIQQTPRSLAEVRRLNAVSDALSTDAPLLAVQTCWNGTKEGRRLPVYAAPDKDSFRASEGKAAVSMGGDVEILGTRQGWTLIQYEVSTRTSRIGWIEGEFAADVPLTFAAVPLIAAADTFLTDDPFVSQYAQAYIPKGAELTGLARCGEYYAYVSFRQGDSLYQGFVPMKDLHPKADRALTVDPETLYANAHWDVMDCLTGKWVQAEGGSGRMILFFDGGYRSHMAGDSSPRQEVGNYRIYDSAEGGYTLMIFTEDNQERVYGLTLNEDGSIDLWDSGAGSVRYVRPEYSTYGNG
ncbi:MAG: hypothetical protein IJB81_10045 [Clostridia bacterium]|nr:hypothetical protein [Clostridia bacterium]